MRHGWIAGLALAALAGGCGGGGDDDDPEPVVLRADSFDGAFPGTAWTPLGDLGLDAAAGAPAPSLRLGGGEVGVVTSGEAFSTAEGLTVRMRVSFGLGGDANLMSPDGSRFVEVAESPFAPGDLNVLAGGVFGRTSYAADGSFHDLEIQVAPGGAAVVVRWDGVVVVDNPAAQDPQPPTLEIRVRGEAGAATRIDEVVVTAP